MPAERLNDVLLRRKMRQRSKRDAGRKNGPINRNEFDIHSNIPFFSFFGFTFP